MQILNSTLFILSIAVLFYAGGLMVRSLTVLGRYLKLSEYVLSFILVSFATSLPELFVGISSAVKGASLLSLGNIVGANVLNISLVLGVAIIFARGLNVERPMEKEDYFFTLGIMLVPILTIIDGVISRIEGGFLLGLFFIYILYLVESHHRKNIVDGNVAQEDRPTPANTINHLLLFLLGAGMLLGSSYFVVNYSVDLALYFSVPLFLVGILISIGTTLPEVVFSFKSVSMKHGSMSLGNAYGSIIVNVALILGLVSVINPIVIENVSRTVVGLATTALLLIGIQILAFIRGRLEYWLGMALVFVALFFILIESLIK